MILCTRFFVHNLYKISLLKLNMPAILDWVRKASWLIAIILQMDVMDKSWGFSIPAQNVIHILITVIIKFIEEKHTAIHKTIDTQ